MHSLTIVFGQNHSVVWTLMFREEEKANDARLECTRNHGDAGDQTVISIVDDFGQQIVMRSKEVIAVMLEDMTKSRLAHIERSINHAHMQSDLQRAVEADPKLRIARNMQGPAMISPMGNGRM